ncbi:MAG TPA: hypothetical protein VHF27_02230 [Acidimicrobiales bacterium]|nr:hypothetical protein [Acidimicrobiales bacterium]
MVERSDDDTGFREPPDGLLTTPENRVLAHMDRPGDVAAVIEQLGNAGVPPDQVYVLRGPKGAERLDVSGEQHGLRGRTYRIMEWMGDERDVLLRSGDHVAAGGLVVTVPTDEADKAEAARILADHGAHDIAHFGKGHWEHLGS